MTEFGKALNHLRVCRKICLGICLIAITILGGLPFAGEIAEPMWPFYYASFPAVMLLGGVSYSILSFVMQGLKKEGEDAYHERLKKTDGQGGGLTFFDVTMAICMCLFIISGAMMAFEYSRSVRVGYMLESASRDERVISTSVDYTAAAENLLEDLSVSSAAKVTMTEVDARLEDRICAWSSDGELSVWALRKLSDTGAEGLVPQKYHKEYNASVEQFCDKAAKVAFD